MAAVLLGYPGDLVEPEDEPQLDYTVTKVGGAPFYPGATPPALVEASGGSGGDKNGGRAATATAAAAPLCRVCNKPLSLVLQAYAPQNGADCRCLLVFGCVLKGCGRKPGSWRAWRCELRLPKQEEQQEPAAGGDGDGALAAPQPPPSAAKAGQATTSIPGFDDASLGDAWGIESGGGGGGAFSFGGDDHGAGASGSGFDFSDLAAAVEQATAKLSAPKPKAANQQAAAASADARLSETARRAPPGGSCRGAAGPRLPEFYVEAGDEPAEAGVPERELAHARELLAAYRAAAASDGAADGGGGGGGGGQEAPATAAARPAAAERSGGKSAAAAAAADAGAGAGEEDAWAGEGYEPATMRGVERAYVKFAKRLARAPGQVARYCPRGGAPLWPAAAAPAPALCARCGAPRAFELQLMPGLIAALGEAADMEAAAGRGGGGVSGSGGAAAAALDAALQWDWATVAVFTCSAGCAGGAGGSTDRSGAAAAAAREEAVVIVNESDVHTLRAAAAAEAAAAEAGIVL